MSFQQTCGHQFSRDDRSQNLCSAAWSESMIRDITWLFRAEMLPEAGLTQHYMNSYLSATTPRWMENMGNCRRSPWQNLSSVQFTSFSTPITCQSLRGRRLRDQERYSKALQQNTPKMSHGPIIARSERDKNWKVVFINRRWTPILQPVKLFLARLFSSLKLLLKSASAFFSHPTWTKFSKDKFRFVHCGPVK